MRRVNHRHAHWPIGGSTGETFLAVYKFSDGVYKVVSRIHVPLICSEPSLLLFQRPPTPCLSVMQFTSVFWIGWERIGPLWQQCIEQGKQGAHSHALTFPCGRNCGPKGSLLALKLLPWDKGDMSKVKLFILLAF